MNEKLEVTLIAFVWNSLVAWLFVGLFAVANAIWFHLTWSWEATFIWWGWVLLIGYLS